MTAKQKSDPLLTTAQIAIHLGIDPGTWRGYVSRGYAPKPDVPDDSAPPNRRNPRWLTSTVDLFARNRTGAGRRTDLDATKK